MAEGKFLHAGQPMMNWCVGNAKGVYQGNAMTIRSKSQEKPKLVFHFFVKAKRPKIIP